MILDEPLLFEISKEGREGHSLPELKNFEAPPVSLLRKKMAHLPRLSELDVVRHFTRLSQTNFSIDTNFYPLGSCTMKYNPRINEETSRYTGFAHIHPYQPDETVQGCLKLIVELEKMLAEISGMDAVTLQPAAGAQGELVGMMMIRALLTERGNPRTTVLIPDSAHGTNPASCGMANYKVLPVKTGKDGCLKATDVRKMMTDDVAALMLTNPNTLGLFEKEIIEICKIVHEKGGLVYGDGANMNAILGKCRPGDLGVDVIQYNLHKTFTTPHGGGGPGSGPVAVKKELEPFLPYPRVTQSQAGYHLDENRTKSIGRIRAFFGNFGMLVRAYTYIREMGPDGLKNVAELAVLNANYIRARLEPFYHLPFQDRSLHEVVFTDKKQKETGISTMDIAKRLLDFGIHPPTIYFPLVVIGALMIEPTETESMETLDHFCDTMIRIAKEAQENPKELHDAPTTAPRTRLDEAKAARQLKLRFEFS